MDVTPTPAFALPKSTGYTITYEESLREVPWQTDNRYIRKGYRRRLKDAKSVLFSLVGCTYLAAICCTRELTDVGTFHVDWHNETGEIRSNDVIIARADPFSDQ